MAQPPLPPRPRRLFTPDTTSAGALLDESGCSSAAAVRTRSFTPPVGNVFITEVRRLGQAGQRRASGGRGGTLCFETPHVSSRVGSAGPRLSSLPLVHGAGRRCQSGHRIDLRLPRQRPGGSLQGLTCVHNSQLADLLTLISEPAQEPSPSDSQREATAPQVGGVVPASQAASASTFDRRVQELSAFFDARRLWTKHAESALADATAPAPPRLSTFISAEDPPTSPPQQHLGARASRRQAGSPTSAAQGRKARRSPCGRRAERPELRGWLPKKLEVLRSDVTVRRSFFESVRQLQEERAMLAKGTAKASARNVEQLPTWSPMRRRRIRERQARQREANAAEVRQRARAISDGRKAAAAAAILAAESREQEHVRAAEDHRALLRRSLAWQQISVVAVSQLLLAATVARHRKARARVQALRQAEGSQDAGFPEMKLNLAGRKFLRLHQPKVRSEAERKEACLVLLRHLRRLVACKGLRRFFADYLRTCEHSIAVRVYRQAVIAVQRNWRQLRHLREWRRWICSRQVDGHIQGMVQDIDARCSALDKKWAEHHTRADAVRNKTTEGRKRTEQLRGEAEKEKEELAQLSRDRGELLRISNSAKTRLIHEWTRNREIEFGNRISEYLEQKQRIDDLVREHIKAVRLVPLELRRAAGEMPASPIAANCSRPAKRGVFQTRFVSRGATWRLRQEKQRAVKELRRRGDIPHLVPPMFPLVTPRHQLAGLVQAIREESKRALKARLAASDTPSPMVSASPPPPPPMPPPPRR
eukprot:TRINITY_DN2786_c2_g2_i1.p1 TRINITY_DN2786_c2_g2~~TRINITY_DN2786_c2_g2_i1.p1  ORF type:complete len:774 (+),score=249.51 TRINITY_DN2786_c2_g2_i1:35-2323(+)